VLACFALLLATVPQYLINEEISQLKQEETKGNSPIILEVKGVKFTFGKDTKEPEIVDHTENIKKLGNYLKISEISMFVFVAGTIFMSIFALHKEKKNALTIGSIITACVSLTWHYVAVGISIAVAVFILLILIVNLSL
jgi:ABC-type multidrug transport system permease subunit